MTVSSASSDQSGTWPQLESGPLITGGILIGVGGVIALTGLAIAGMHVAAATRSWIQELEIPPGELARLKWEQAKTAAASGATTWREHPNAKAKLTRRSS
ncbi:MAG: hypothetical protein WAK82_33115 [Streptosporangiaceae bacterium]